MNRVFTETKFNELFSGPNGETFQREYGITPNGDPLHGKWVLRDTEGAWVDYDKYSSDMAERHGIELQYMQDDV